MPGFPLTVAAVASCFHQGHATIAPDQTAVIIQGAPAATATSLITVVGCPFTPVAYHPCVLIRWLSVSTKVSAQGKPLILMPPPGSGVGPGIGQAADQAPQGPPTVMTNQLKVLVT
jgi:hypothetical protein